MSHPLFWTAADFDDPMARLVTALGDLEGQELERMYDLWGAKTPEDAALPMSYWTKERILFYVRSSESLRAAEPVLKRMTMDDLKPAALVRVGTIATGRIHDWESREWRHTDFYSLDSEWIRSIVPEVKE